MNQIGNLSVLCRSSKSCRRRTQRFYSVWVQFFFTLEKGSAPLRSSIVFLHRMSEHLSPPPTLASRSPMMTIMSPLGILCWTALCSSSKVSFSSISEIFTVHLHRLLLGFAKHITARGGGVLSRAPFAEILARVGEREHFGDSGYLTHRAAPLTYLLTLNDNLLVPFPLQVCWNCSFWILGNFWNRYTFSGWPDIVVNWWQFWKSWSYPTMYGVAKEVCATK